ncbi:DUF3999 family protein [Dokdonella sp.]|uniref:DUF3999 family protein n=1 Tax=Dokdonella sp. TaxID=2291710 RepID=UPI003C4C2732
MKRLAAFLLIATQSVAADTAADYAAVFPIETHGNESAWLIELDGDVYRWSQDEQLRDIAIFNAAGNPVPLGTWDEIVPTTAVDNEALLPLLNLPVTLVPNQRNTWRSQGDNRTRDPRPVEVRARGVRKSRSEWLLDASALNFGVDTITLDWTSPTSDVVARFNVAGSSDLEHWMNSANSATVVALEQDGTRIERRDIRLQPGKFPYFLLTRLDDGVELVGLQATVSGKYHVRGKPLPLQQARATHLSTVNDSISNEVQYRYVLPARLPVSHLRISLSEENALARVQVLAAMDANDGSTRWNSRGQTVAYRLRRGEDLIESPEMLLSPGARVRELRIDSATPLSAPPQIDVRYRAQRVVFLAEGEGPYVLAVGSAVARHPEYPMGTAIAKLREQASWQPPSAELGAMRTSAGQSAIEKPVVRKDAQGWKRWLLWAVLILAATVVGGFALSLLRGNSERGTVDGQQPPEQ